MAVIISTTHNWKKKKLQHSDAGMDYCYREFKLATFLLTAVFFVEGFGEESLEQQIAALRPGLIVCSSSGSSMGPAQRLRAEAERDVQVCCLREDVLERVDQVVVPASNGTHVTLTRGALFDNMAAQPDGRYACVAMVRNRSASAAATQSGGSSGGVTVVGSAFVDVNDELGFVTEPSKVELEVLDEFGSHYEDGDRVLVVSHDSLVLRYRYGVSADATLLEQVSGEEPWRRPVSFSSKSGIRRHEGSLVLWEVARPLVVFVQVTLHSRPPLAKSVMLNLVVVPRLTVGMPCHEDGDCRSVNGLCMERQCRCSFALDVNGTCVVVACKSHFQCSHERLHTVCFRNSCQCAHGFRDVDGTCTPIECSHDVECRDPLMRCRNASCDCSEGYIDNGERCTPNTRHYSLYLHPQGTSSARGLRTAQSRKRSAPVETVPAPKGLLRLATDASERSFYHKEMFSAASDSPKKCVTNDDCKWSDLCLNRPCVCRREPFSLTGVCLESDRQSSSYGRSTTSSHKLFVAAAGIGIVIVTAAALVLFFASFSKKEGVEMESITGRDDGGDRPASEEWYSENQHMDATIEEPPDTFSITPTESQLSFQDNVIVHTT
ncbi:hypothetical protein HPB49_016918 [Dermacentor silvarum]|uniref:Uncharacterized protein n=1 Tax=Dermacentor silvarum TaxID=543639 RepID=A0ACB8DK18_DERSI|nr:hypothetical protein HPB49_016918 [Dermacentor silvarum]